MKSIYQRRHGLYFVFIIFLTFKVDMQAAMITSPFTGQPVSEEYLLDRLYAVMIDNARLARPHDGLSKAPIVFEALVEGGMTRYCAFFLHEKPNKIGPIRSIRHYFLDIVCGYGALPVHFGFSYIALDQIQKENIQTISGTRTSNEIFQRDQTRKAPNNVYTSIEKIANEAQRLAINPMQAKGFAQFGSGNFTGESSATEIVLHFSASYSVKYSYRSDIQMYKRYIAHSFQDEKEFLPHIDQGYQEQITAKNILILRAHTETISGDTCDRQNIVLNTSGKGFYITNGNMMKITWYKEHRYAPFVFMDSNDEEITLSSGNTWVEIFPHYADYVIS